MYEQHQYNGQHGGHGYRPPYVNSGFSCRPIVLDDYNSDLNFVVGADGLTGSCLHQDGFEYLWAGARATHGVSSGKVCFEVVVGEKLPVNMPETERTPHVVRIGWSTDFSSLQVGEDAMSYGYGGTGKCSVNNRFFDYGQPYSTNDVIGCYINLDAKSIFFTKNGHYLAEAFRLGPETQDIVFYPHVTMKNMKVHMNFERPYYPPIEGYSMIQHVSPNLLIRATGSPDTRKDCQVIMMVGVPACGKTFWAKEYANENKHKKFNIIGTNAIIDRMKVMGLARQRNYHGRWDALIKQATDILNKILKIAQNKNRNYILDQTNVYTGARKRKIGCFHGFHCIAAVVINKDEVLQYRTKKQEKEEGKIVPESAVMEMKANFTLPTPGNGFDEVWFIEENEQSSKRLVEQYNREGKEYKERVQERNVQPANSSGHVSSNTNVENPPVDPRAPNQAGCSSHNPRVYHGHDSRPFGFNTPRDPFNPPHVRPPASFPLSHEDHMSGTARHNPERGGYSMGGSRYSPYDAPRRHMYDAYQNHQYSISNQQQYNNRGSYTQQYTQDYGRSYAYDRQEVSVEYYSVEETRQPGCNQYEHLTPGIMREPVENEYHDYYHERQQYGGPRGSQGYPTRYPYNRGSRY
ncbi:heterogeneous nuclear ribonucleoprotein U-like protein 1 [Actinia tenebrosa]|uniref:Heterogeneous nuclear ribonucleoprotein U-like protein 1 n=1 Tax=Actinia tenebrosa TaxID=6105 RepID=A0A6P8HAJ0_ACTTE|nr:heterogeneous nuclear ribonucleoprotein U-like protein 1 [Actinia tenebrosa]